MRPVIKLRFTNTEPFFGPGIASLFREIESTGNVRSACEKCGFSYSKGWKIIRRCEKEFGYEIVDRVAGGQSGGAAKVTEKGLALLAAYDEMLGELESISEQKFRLITEKYGLGGEDNSNDNTTKEG